MRPVKGTFGRHPGGTALKSKIPGTIVRTIQKVFNLRNIFFFTLKLGLDDSTPPVIRACVAQGSWDDHMHNHGFLHSGGGQWAKKPYWQFFCGGEYFETRLLCDPSGLTRFRRALGDAGVEELLAKTIEAAVSMQAIAPKDLERVIVDSTVQERAIAFPTDSRLLDVARRKLVLIAKRAGLVLRQTFEKEGRSLKRRAGCYAHARQFRRLRRGGLKRQRTILGRVMRDLQRRLPALADGMWLERARRIHTQRWPKDKNKLYALHAPEVECIGQGKAQQPYEFGVKVGIATTEKGNLIVGARASPGTPTTVTPWPSRLSRRRS